eukprot:CAMPEP_0115472664 /NCGR_PEP_ID=MMETSP0271-20121206/53165_1 /TAXON_ID=71861 /ORGANISM="Scrippsiella trochoidea, Strain CCMP3099" /LENGTH=63 /DNA_ID=CAMNT_0002899907 /DNA_START=207 /DNA_END=394 /DNA_ORIENTATION=-
MCSSTRQASSFLAPSSMALGALKQAQAPMAGSSTAPEPASALELLPAFSASMRRSSREMRSTG